MSEQKEQEDLLEVVQEFHWDFKLLSRKHFPVRKDKDLNQLISSKFP